MHKKTLDMRRGMCAAVLVNGIIRWLMPHEVERLFGFPDDWTACISNTQRLKALGNSMAVPVVQFVLSCCSDLPSPPTA